jgi:hypothetical protein
LLLNDSFAQGESEMKLVFNREEVAEALCQSEQEFTAIQEKLEAAGFPKPVRVLEDRWPIMDVINWVNNNNVDSIKSA